MPPLYPSLGYNRLVSTFHFTLRRTFVADHFHDLPGFQEARHGHNWEVEATIAAEGPEEELTFSRVLDAWVKEVNYTLLNEQPVLAGRNPTTEMVGFWALEYLEGQGLAPVQVKVREKANYWAACRR